MKSKSIAVVLALFLGGFGAHRFYLRQPGWGVLFAVFFWTFIPGLVAIVDIFRYLFMSDEKFQKRYSA